MKDTESERTSLGANGQLTSLGANGQRAHAALTATGVAVAEAKTAVEPGAAVGSLFLCGSGVPSN